MNRIILIVSVLFAAAQCAGAGPARAGEDHPFYPERFASPEAARAASDSIAYSVNIMDKSRIGMTISNYGFIGTNFTSRAPSFEYPMGTGFQHMVRGGIWVGGASFDTAGFYGVSTAAQDGSAGSGSAAATEYTPGTKIVYQRSTLPNSRYYRAGAVSEQDFISLFRDQPAKKATGYREDHRPLGVAVTQYNFSWSFSDYANINFFHYVIRNDGPPLVDAYVGMYDELASGNMTSYSQLPPGGWFNKKQIAWVDSLNLFLESYCLNKPIPTNCYYSLLPYSAGVKLLGVHPGNISDPTKKVSLSCWSYSPGSYARDEDVEKYGLMSTGLKSTLVPLPDSLAPYSGDPVSLLAVGPFSVINTGDSVSVDFAYIGAPQDVDLSGNLTYVTMMKYARTAQSAYDLNYLVPVPPPSPRTRLVVRNNAVDLYWERSPEDFVDSTTFRTRSDFEGYRVYLGEERGALHQVAQFDSCCGAFNDTTGYNTGFGRVRLDPPVTIDGQQYQYRYTVDHLRNGFKYWTAVTSYDLGTPQIESLESGIDQNLSLFVPSPSPTEAASAGVTVFPNPYRVEAAWDAGRFTPDHYLWFANLPQECDLKIYTLAGSVVYETHFDGRTYKGGNASGIFDPTVPSSKPANLSGSMWGWNMVTRMGQAAATGLYLWAVEDSHTGKRQRGKFLIVKSDRERTN